MCVYGIYEKEKYGMTQHGRARNGTVRYGTEWRGIVTAQSFFFVFSCFLFFFFPGGRGSLTRFTLFHLCVLGFVAVLMILRI